MIKIKPFLIATLLLTGFALPAVAQIGEARNNLSVGINGGVNLNSASFTPTIKQNSLMGITGGLTARYIFCHDLWRTGRVECLATRLGPII
jgi:hypothetical protein